MSRSLEVTLGVARRTVRALAKNPGPALPPMLLPLFFFAAVSGAMSTVSTTKGFDYYNYTAFAFVFVLYMAAIFVGVFTGIDVASDFTSGVGARMMLAAPRRIAILGGYVLTSFVRGLLGIVVVGAIAIATGMPVRGDAIEIAGLIGLAMMLNVATTLYAAGLALRLRSVGGSVLILIPTFMAMFLTPAFIPRKLLSGWLRTAADINPLTPAMEAGRGFMAHQPVSVALAFACSAGLIVAFLLWAATGMRRREQGPSGRRRRAPRRPRR